MIISLLNYINESISKSIPPGFIMCVAAAFIDDNKYLSAWRHEFVGTLLMIGFTFSAGKWIGVDSLPLAWTAHACGVVAADYVGGGPHVNPAVTVAMLALGKVTYTEGLIRMFGAMAGGLLAFPLFKLLSETLKWEPLGGPAFDPPQEVSAEEEEAAVISAYYNEFFATFLLCIAIFVLNFELNFGKYHYWIKQPLTALAIRYLIEVFGTTGPAMNPMLATTWAVFDSSESLYPIGATHYFVYWVGPFLAATLASLAYVIYAGGNLFGKKVPFGPVKSPAPEGGAAPSSSPKKKKGTKKE